jgi:hypothetical protein
MPVNLVVRSAVGMQLSDNITLSTPTGNDYVFSSVTFGFAALFDVVATTFDAFGNGAQSAACQMTANDLPTLAVSVPTSNFVVNAANAAASDCDVGTGGLQLQVTASTNATNGSDATIQIGTATAFVTTVMAGSISGCVDAPQGAVNVVVDVDDTTTGDGVSGTAQISVPIVVDTLTPTATFAPTVTILNHRIATVQLDFIAQDDGGIAFASYDLRCAGAAITTELAWSAATPVALGSPPPPPLDGGQAELFVLGEMANRIFRTGVRYHCVLRAADIGGNLTPIPASNTEIFPQFQQTSIDGLIANGQMGFNGARTIGDVNNDGTPDLFVTGLGSGYLWLSSGALGTTSPVTIAFPRGGSSRLGLYAAGVGDFDGDSIDDFALSDIAENSNAGAVYIFRGRSDWSALGASFVIGATGCDADLCVRGTAANQFVGYDVTGPGDFDDDGDDDVAFGIRGTNHVFVLSGRTLTGAAEISLANPPDPLAAGNPDGFLITQPVGSSDYGWRMAALGDSTADGIPDMIVMSVGWNGTSFALAPALYRVVGRTRFTAGITAIASGESVPVVADRVLPATMGTFGLRSTLAAVDFDGDGRRDIAIRESATGASGVRVFFNDGFGGFTNASSVEISAAVGASGDFLGVGIGSSYHPTLDVGDIDGDGFEDVVAGALQAGVGSVASGALAYGRARPGTLPSVVDWVQSSLAAIVSPTPLPTMVAAPSTAFRWVGYIGDVDGDGFEDVAVADPAADGATPAGRVFILH